MTSVGRQSIWFAAIGGMVLCLFAPRTLAEPHPCQRDCGGSGVVDERGRGRGGGGAAAAGSGGGRGGSSEPMTCRYQWLVENYVVLSRACYDCPSNSSDCWRPDCVSADGVRRSIRTINRQLPAPSIQVCEGDTVEVEVTNQMMMSEGLTIHWHGLRQRGSQHMDGVSMVTQCPIPTFSSFTYRFLAEDPGTHFYHSHSGMYRGDGIYGPLVIRQSGSRDPQRALYDLDLPEHVITLSDWTHVPIVELYAQFFHGKGSPAPANILINGRGAYPSLGAVTTHHHHLNHSSVTPLARFDVRDNLRYRFRVFNAGALRCPLVFSVDHHPLLLIASDGRPLKPVSMASITIFSGERYDFVLETKKELAGVHWIRVRGLDLCERLDIQQFAILNYQDGHVTDDVSRYPDESTSYQAAVPTEGLHFNRWFLNKEATDPDEHAQIMNMTSLLPDDASLREKADRQILLEFAYRLRMNTHYMDPDFYPARGKGYKTVTSPMINNISNLLPPAPLLTQPHDVSPELMCNGESMKEHHCNTKFCECIHRVSANEGEVVEFVIYNSNKQYGYTHPFHLHGYGFRVVAVERLEEKITEKRFLEMDRKGQIHRRLHGAPVKDTLPVPNGGYMILRIVADNPGAWFMHCHVALHAEVGMSLTLQVTNAEGQMPAPPPSFPRCGIWPKAGHSVDDVSRPSDVRGGRNDVRIDAASSGAGEGAWAVPVLISLVCVNVVMAVLGVFYCVKNNRGRWRKWRGEEYQFIGAEEDRGKEFQLVGGAKDRKVRFSSQDESRDLLGH